MSEELNKEFDAMLEDVMGGDPEKENHSPDAPEGTENALEAEDAPDAKETFDPYGDEEADADDSAQEDGKEEEKKSTPEKSDSVPEEKTPAPDAEKTALQEEVANYKKRLHDTQSAMHKANEEKAKLQKELDAIKSRQKKSEDDDENWFRDDDTKDEKTAELESKIEAIEEKQEQYRREQAVNEWTKEAEKVAAEHEDFNTLVYEKLEPLLDEENGDPAMLAAYTRWKDKSPAGAYEFAKRVFGTEEKLKAPEAPVENNNKEARPVADPSRGKAGLDRINSADFAETKRSHGNMIDEVFG